MVGIRIYEAFKGNRADNGQPISWMIESRAHQPQALFDVGIFRNYWLQFREIYGLVEIQGAYRSSAGTYQDNLDALVLATPGSVGLPDDLVYPYRTCIPQGREIKSAENDRSELCAGTCNIEDQNPADRGNYFSFLLKGKGIAGLRAYQINVANDTQPAQGECYEPEDGYRLLESCACGTRIEAKLGLDINDPKNNYLMPPTSGRRQYAAYTPVFCDLDYVTPQPIPEECSL